MKLVVPYEKPGIGPSTSDNCGQGNMDQKF